MFGSQMERKPRKLLHLLVELNEKWCVVMVCSIELWTSVEGREITKRILYITRWSTPNHEPFCFLTENNTRKSKILNVSGWSLEIPILPNSEINPCQPKALTTHSLI